MIYVGILFLVIGIIILCVSIFERPTMLSWSKFSEQLSIPTLKNWSMEKLFSTSEKQEQKNIEPKLDPLKHFGMIYYINLDHRVDRRREIEGELESMHVPTSRITRIPGVVYNEVENRGAVGCTMAHISAVNHFLNETSFETCLILEDDFKFILSDDHLDQCLHNFFQEVVVWDVLLLAGVIQKTNNSEPRASCYRVEAASTTSGYAITRKMASVLLENFKAGLEKLKKHYNLQKYAIDEFWKRIQPEYRWYSMKPLAGTQRESYSDINQKVKEVKSVIKIQPMV